jgi:hypothetical protein
MKALSTNPTALQRSSGRGADWAGSVLLGKPKTSIMLLSSDGKAPAAQRHRTCHKQPVRTRGRKSVSTSGLAAARPTVVNGGSRRILPTVAVD